MHSDVPAQEAALSSVFRVPLGLCTRLTDHAVPFQSSMRASRLAWSMLPMLPTAKHCTGVPQATPVKSSEVLLRTFTGLCNAQA
jgi:hypothetical protein